MSLSPRRRARSSTSSRREAHFRPKRITKGSQRIDAERHGVRGIRKFRRLAIQSQRFPVGARCGLVAKFGCSLQYLCVLWSLHDPMLVENERLASAACSIEHAAEARRSFWGHLGRVGWNMGVSPSRRARSSTAARREAPVGQEKLICVDQGMIDV